MKLLVAACAAVVSGCAVETAAAAPPSTGSSDPPADLRPTALADLGTVIAQTRAAITGATANLPGAMSQATLAQLFGTSAGALHELTSPLASRLAMPAGDPVAWLAANVFASSTPDGAYAVPAALVCGPGAQADCAAAVTTAAPRVRLAASDGGVQLFVQLGAAHDEPIAITLSAQELTATFDLDAAGRDLGQPFSGKATIDVTVVGPQHVHATIAFASPVSLGWGGASLTSAAGTPLTIDLDGSRPQLEASLAFGATTVQLGDAMLALAGLATDVGFDGHALTLDRISLGGSSATLARAAKTAIAIDLNPDAGRTFGAVLSTDSDGIETIAVAPSLEIRQQIDHGVLGDTAPVYDVTDLALDAALHGPASAAQLEIVHGSLAIATAPTSYGVTATDARCITQTAATGSNGQSYDQLAVATCQ